MGVPGISLWSPSFRGIMSLRQEPQCAEFGKKVGMDFSVCRSLLDVYVLQDPCMVCLATFTMNIN